MIQQNAKMLNIADEKHAMRKEMDLSKLLLMLKQSLHDAWQKLKKLQALQDYDTDSFETQVWQPYFDACTLTMVLLTNIPSIIPSILPSILRSSLNEYLVPH